MKHFRKINGGFWHGFFAGFGALGQLGQTEFNPPRYPRNAPFLDQKRLGKDMYKAMECINEEIETTQPAAS